MKKYNLALLKEQCGEDKLFFNEMIGIFIDSSQNEIINMEDAYIRKDLTQLGHYAHKILSPCKLIRADSLCILLKEMESKADDNELTLELADLLLRKIKKEMEELTNELRSEYL